ncbi:uncharacterized protein JCM15063_003215 [Sporobolomyces koalae]|uniref:uncharacterized protein n=1 Tax=Sporobolomyces koalae TaxID=500713 RepID=UPI00316B7364
MFTRPLLKQTLQRARYSTGPPPPPSGSIFSASTLYPFLLLSAITSLALNLSHQRTAKSQEVAHLSAQVTVLENLLANVHSLDSEHVERELELVGLGRGKGKLALGEGDKLERNRTSWSEVLFGKKGKQFEPEQDDTDWEKVFREADEAEKASKTASAPETLPSTVLVAPPPPSSNVPQPRSAPTQVRSPPSDQALPPQKPPSSPVYL